MHLRSLDVNSKGSSPVSFHRCLYVMKAPERGDFMCGIFSGPWILSTSPSICQATFAFFSVSVFLGLSIPEGIGVGGRKWKALPQHIQGVSPFWVAPLAVSSTLVLFMEHLTGYDWTIMSVLSTAHQALVTPERGLNTHSWGIKSLVCRFDRRSNGGNLHPLIIL